MNLDLAMTAPSRPPLRYHGGKWRIGKWVASHFPAHKFYVEVFGGAAGVLLQKARSQVEVYNDLDKQVVNLFRILRDRQQALELARLCDFTPFSREEFELGYEFTCDPMEAARRFIIRCYCGHGTSSMDPADSNGFRSCDIRAGKSYAREWAGIPSALVETANRLQGVTIENLDFRKLIPKLDSPDTLFYCDPPYPASTRDAGGKGYVHELSDQDHRQLAWLLKNSRAKVAISGYRCRLYDELYAGWRSVEKNTIANGQKGAVPRTEILWMNY